jgi:hypothetical protein
VKRISLFSLIFLSFLSAKAVLTGFDEPVKIDKKKTIVKKKIMVKKINKKEIKIKDAIVWQLVDRNFLGKKFSKEEQEIIDNEAVQRFIDAAQANNPELFKIYHSKKKNLELVQRITRRRRELEFIDNYINTRNQREEKQQELVIQEINKINSLYLEMKEAFQEKSKISKKRYQEIKYEITKCCGLENFLFVENLLRREINYASFSI